MAVILHTITAEPWYPGVAIPTPLTAGGYGVTADSRDVRFSHTDVSGGGIPGYTKDPNWKLGGHYGAQAFLLNITGEGRSVDIVMKGRGTEGLSAELIKVGNPDWTPLSGVTSPDSSETTITAVLEAGVQYLVEIGSITYYATGEYDQIFDVVFRYTGDTGGGDGGTAPANDKRENAIVIPIAGAQRYAITSTVNVSNATRDTGDYGDPWALGMDQSIWYTWTADVTGECAIIGYHDPLDADPAFNIQVIDQTANDSLTLHFHMDESPKTFNAAKGHTYYFALGLEGFSGPSGFTGTLAMSLKAAALPGPKKPVKAKPPGTSSVLDLIREFQRESHLVVRIINDRTISIVDPDEPLPNGMTAGGSESYYVATESSLTSSLDELMLKKANLQFDGHVVFREADISLLTSGWKIAGRIPFPGSDPVPVSRLHARFTPDGCQIECDLFYDKDVLPPAILKNPIATAGDETETP